MVLGSKNSLCLLAGTLRKLLGFSKFHFFLCEMGLAIVPLAGSEQHSAGHLSAPQMLAPRVNLTIIHGLFNSSRCTPFTIISSPLGLEG